MNIHCKPSCYIIIICFPDKTIFILLDCFTPLLQIQPKKSKNGKHFVNIQKFSITDPPPRSGSLVSRVSMETEYQHRPCHKYGGEGGSGQ